MINILSLKTSQLDKNLINNILKLKNTHWKSGMKSQANFFNKNISKSDIHILLFLKKKISGYVLLRKKKYIFKNKKYNYLHFDTLIIKESLRNKKLSPFLMNYVNNIISVEKKSLFFIVIRICLNFTKNMNGKKSQKININ